MRNLRPPGPAVVVIVCMLVIVLRVLTMVTMPVWMVMVAKVIIVIGGVWVFVGSEVTHGGQVSFHNWRAGSSPL